MLFDAWDLNDIMKKKILFIVGPTASGKSKLAVALAKKINGEIISCDSMQVYKGLRIISNRPSKAQLGSAPHHLVGTLDPHDDFNANKFVSLSKQLIEEILGRGKVPIFVGGTGLYMDALLYGLFEGPAAQPAIRLALYKEAERFGKDYLYQRLKKVDVQAAAKIHPHDLRRITRALEVYEITKRPITELQKQRKGLLDDRRFDIRIFGLNIHRDKLYKNINSRVDKMFKKGVVSEVRDSLNKRTSQVFRQALGIKEINAYLKGKIDLDTAKKLLKQNTRRYAKRQLTWFRKNKRIKWLDGLVSANTIVTLLNKKGG